MVGNSNRDSECSSEKLTDSLQTESSSTCTVQCVGKPTLSLRLNPVESSGLGLTGKLVRSIGIPYLPFRINAQTCSPRSTCIEILCDFALFSQNMRAALVLGFSVLPRDVAVIHSRGIPREDNHREFQY